MTKKKSTAKKSLPYSRIVAISEDYGDEYTNVFNDLLDLKESILNGSHSPTKNTKYFVVGQHELKVTLDVEISGLGMK